MGAKDPSDQWAFGEIDPTVDSIPIYAYILDLLQIKLETNSNMEANKEKYGNWKRKKYIYLMRCENWITHSQPPLLYCVGGLWYPDSKWDSRKCGMAHVGLIYLMPSTTTHFPPTTIGEHSLIFILFLSFLVKIFEGTNSNRGRINPPTKEKINNFLNLRLDLC